MESLAPQAPSELEIPPSSRDWTLVADFICFEAKLIVEADGPHHRREDQQAHDVARDAWFAANGFTVLRLSGDEIVGDAAMAVRKIECALNGSNPSA